MANLESLQASVAKAAEKVAKCKATIERHHVQLGKKLAAAQKLNAAVTLENMVEFKWADGRGTDLYWPICEVESKLSDIKDSGKKLAEAEQILANWQAKLDAATEKDRLISDQAPAVLVEFLNQWKEMAREWYLKALVTYAELSDVITDEEEALQKRFEQEFPGEHTWGRKFDDYRKGPAGKALRTAKAQRASLGALTANLATYHRENERMARLEKVLEEERQAKLFDLVNRVNAVVGEITDASGLRINEKGNLDGIITGTKADAKVETIGAGGYNIQVFHYRTLVHEIN